MELTVALIAKPVIDAEAIDKFLESNGASWRRDASASDPEKLVEFSGRICYFSFGTQQSSRSNQSYIDSLIDHEHESVLEHATWTFVLSGISRAFSHQLVRHRVGFSYSQLSQQYVDQSDVEFVEPLELTHYPELASKWEAAVESLRGAYKEIQEMVSRDETRGTFSSDKEFVRFARSVARSILPNATETKLVFTANARALRHFLRIRGSVEGDLEMRKVSARILEILLDEAPSLFRDLRVERLSDGSPIVRSFETKSAQR